MGDAGVTDKEYTRLVAITDGPSDEIGVRLAAQGGFDHVFNEGEGGGVCGVLESMEDSGAIAVGEIELTRRVGSKVM